MSHSIAPAQILASNLALLQDLPMTRGVLDLACGSGRNGLFLAQHKLPVTFADKNSEALATIRSRLQQDELPGEIWQIDLEQEPDTVLDGRQFDAIVICNYLHRPLFPGIRAAVRPGGLVFYQTFTIAQREFGRPVNPDFLLRPGEITDYFNDWQVLHNYEGELTEPRRAVAQLIARKPST